jgi:SPX domain protein involved in polyphosphate accumulation
MVGFGDELKRKQVPEYRLHYIDYDGLKRVLEQGNQTSELGVLLAQAPGVIANNAMAASAPAAVSFLSLLEDQMTKVSHHVGHKMQSIESMIKAVSDQVDNPAADMAVIGEEVQTIEMELVELDRFRRLNIEGFRKIIKKFDKTLRERASVWLGARLAKEGFASLDLEPPLHALAAIHERMRVRLGSKGSKGSQGTSTWSRQASTEFKRSVTKYWVRADDVVDVVVRIVREMPIFIPQEESGGRTSGGGTSGGGSALGQWVSSVYLDSASFESYHARLNMEEGSQLHRLRFYGLSAESAPAV